MHHVAHLKCRCVGLQVAMLALIESKQLRAGGGSSAYAAQLFNYAKYQIDYALGDSGRSWLIGFGSDYPEYIWHKLSYNTCAAAPHLQLPCRCADHSAAAFWCGTCRLPWRQ
jgi:Glycosyl hydrolase family 9